jgi:mono/diheme cytochrome c family protein
LRGVEPQSGRAALWEGTSVAALVSERVEAQRGVDTVVVRTRDRAAIPVPLTVVRQLKPVLADRADGTRLAVPLLAWPIELQTGLATDPRVAMWWARDVVAFELVDWQRTYGPALAAPDGAVDAARRGAGLFAEACVGCHRVRGVGGERGPELTTVAEKLQATVFAERLARHPGWHASVHDPDGAGELWTFLRTVAAAAAAGGGAVEGLAADRAPGTN